MSTGKHKIPDQALTKKHMDQAIKTLLARVEINNKYWLPDLGGYSKDWSVQPVVYFDARLPDYLKVGSKFMRPYRYLLIHESVEKSLMDELGLSYDVAHDFATSAEKSAVEADGFNWAEYTAALQPYIHQATIRPGKLDSPPDLDLTPYQQDKSHETASLEIQEKGA